MRKTARPDGMTKRAGWTKRANNDTTGKGHKARRTRTRGSRTRITAATISHDIRPEASHAPRNTGKPRLIKTARNIKNKRQGHHLNDTHRPDANDGTGDRPARRDECNWQTTPHETEDNGGKRDAIRDERHETPHETA